MKIGIVSDTHSNAQALQAVLNHMNEHGVSKKVHLGNIVGLCAEPNRTIELTVENFNFITFGHLDEDILDKERLNWLRASHKEVAEWTTGKTSGENKQLLSNLEFGYLLEDGLAFSHNNEHVDAKLLFCGSIHYSDGEIKIPHVARLGGDKIAPRAPRQAGSSSYTVKLEDNAIYTIGIGSCGYPTDGDNRASYAIYDTDKREVVFYKVPYSLDRTVGKMQQEGFPQKIINKVLHGV